jgi:phage recombination protein Bet
MEDSMSTAIAVTEKREARLAHAEFSSEQTRLLAETVAKGCDQNELAFFLQVCKLKRLDPFTQQVHCVKRWDSDLGRSKMTIQVGIDGFRVIAARTGDLAGITEPEFDSEEEKAPSWARVTVFRYGRGDEKIPYTAKARFSEYVQTKKDGTPNHMWTNKPYIMLGKCAEALALRKAFPDELSGMYSDDEMGQADNEHEGQHKAKPPVTQPSRASEKKAEAPKEESKPGEVKLDRISGTIETLKEGTKGAVWIEVDKKIIMVIGDMVDDDIHVGNEFLADCLKLNNPKLGVYWEAKIILESPKTGEIQDAEIIEETTDPVANFSPLPAGAPTLDDLKATGAVKPASSVEAPKTLGKGRAQRLWTLMTHNAKQTGLTQEIVYKEILAKLPVPKQHLSDVEFSMKEFMEKIMTGEVDWRDLFPKEG